MKIRVSYLFPPLLFLTWAGTLCLGAPQGEDARPTATPLAEEAPSDAIRPTPEDAKPSANVDESEDRDGDRERRRKRRKGGGNVRLFGGSVRVAPDEIHDGDIVLFGGSATIEGTQRGDVVVFGGTIDVSGNASGDVVAIGGSIRVRDGASIHGDTVTVGGRLDRAEGAVVEGEQVEVGGGVGHFLPAAIPMGLGLGALGWTIFGWAKTAVLALLLALVIAAVLPTRVEAAGQVLRQRWLACLGWGFAAFVLSIPATLLLSITCVGVVIPFIFYQVAKYFGLTVLFAVIGNAVARTGLKRDLTLLPAAVVGFLLLSLIGLLAPAWWIYSWLAVGCALLTRFGTLRPWFRRDPPPAFPPTTTTAASAPLE